MVFCDVFRCWFPYAFVDGCLYALLKAAVPLRMQDVSGPLGEDKVIPGQDIVWSIGSAVWRSMDDGGAQMRPFPGFNPEVLIIPAGSPAVVNARYVESEA